MIIYKIDKYMKLANRFFAHNVVLAIAMVAFSLFCASLDASAGTVFNTAESQVNTVADSKNTSKTISNDFKPFDFVQDFKGNPFSFFMGDEGHGVLLCAGDKSGANAMTIGWGTLGTLWEKPIVTIYVRGGRHTHQFLEKCPYFTIMKFADTKVTDYMGTHSGRDGDKASALGLHIAYTKNGTPYYKEATEVIECRIMYARPFSKEGYRDSVPQEVYTEPATEADIHTEYIAEIVGAMKK